MRRRAAIRASWRYRDAIVSPLPTAVVLPTDGRIPRRRADGRARLAPDARWEQPYQSRFVSLPGEPERTAWLHFCLGHHLEFLYWETTTMACERIVAAVDAGDGAAVARWTHHAARLIRGSGALLHYCSAFDPGVYDPCLRDSMAAERGDFSGDMSRDFLLMMRAKADMLDALRGAGRHGHELEALQAAERDWHRHHGEVILALHPGKSLLRETVERLKAESEAFDYRGYVETVVRGEDALAAYDDYFGVERSDDLTLDAYWTQAVAKLALAHGHLPLRGHHRAELMQGDAAVLAILCELESGDDDG
jgi:hypothetical protein